MPSDPDPADPLDDPVSRWDSSSTGKLAADAQRMRDLAKQMDDEGNASLADQIKRAAETVPEPQSPPEP